MRCVSVAALETANRVALDGFDQFTLTTLQQLAPENHRLTANGSSASRFVLTTFAGRNARARPMYVHSGVDRDRSCAETPQGTHVNNNFSPDLHRSGCRPASHLFGCLESPSRDHTLAWDQAFRIRLRLSQCSCNAIGIVSTNQPKSWLTPS